MDLHWDKFQLMQIGCEVGLKTPEGKLIPPKDTLAYLGATIYNTGSVSSELNRRLGAAWNKFCKYARAWKRSSIHAIRKIEVFQSLITTKVMYSLSTAWLNKAERRRLDGFQARCLRKILNIPPAFVCRISNKSVLDKSGQTPYTLQLLRHQLLWFGKVGRAPNHDFTRMLTFQNDTVRSATISLKRRRGRPNNDWATCLYERISPYFTSDVSIMEHARDPQKWEAFIQHFIRSLNEGAGEE